MICRLMEPIVFRCDGDDRVGAGHVGRCLQIARAFVAAGDEVVFEGSYGGAAAAMLDRAGMATRAPGADAARAVIADSYELPAAGLEAPADRVPTAVVLDGGEARAVTAALSYHLDARERIAVPAGTAALLGPEYAPVPPQTVEARRARAQPARGL